MERRNGYDGLSLYLDDIGGFEVLSGEEQEEKALLAQKGDLKARNELIESTLKLAHWYAKRYQGFVNIVDVRDLVNEAVFGINTAIDKFDPEREAKFSTYAVLWIKQSIRRSIENNITTKEPVRIPVPDQELMNRVSKFRVSYFSDKGHYPTMQEISVKLGASLEALERATVRTRLFGRTLSLDGTIQNQKQHSNMEESVQTLAERVSPTSSPYEEISRDILRDIIGKCLDSVNESSFNKRVYLTRIGLDEDFHNTLRVVGARFGITYERVRQIEKKVNKKMMRVLKRDYHFVAEDLGLLI